MANFANVDTTFQSEQISRQLSFLDFSISVTFPELSEAGGRRISGVTYNGNGSLVSCYDRKQDPMF